MELNSQCPYNITREGEWNYSFITKHGIIYHAYFIDFSNYHPAFDNVYTFNIEPENEEPILFKKDNPKSPKWFLSDRLNPIHHNVLRGAELCSLLH